MTNQGRARPSVDMLTAQGEELAAAGEYDAALWCAAAAFGELAAVESSPLERGRLLRLLATCHQCVGASRRAGELATGAVSALEQGLPDSAAELGEALHTLAITHLEQQDLESALPLLERSAGLLEGKPDRTIELCAVLLTMAEVSKVTGAADEALGLLGKVLDQMGSIEAVSEAHAGALNAITAKAFLGLGGAYGQSGDSATAKDYLARSIEFFDAAYGHGHPEMTEALTEVAAIYRVLGDADAAEAIEEELAVAERMLEEVDAAF